MKNKQHKLRLKLLEIKHRHKINIKPLNSDKQTQTHLLAMPSHALLIIRY